MINDKMKNFPDIPPLNTLDLMTEYTSEEDK